MSSSLTDDPRRVQIHRQPPVRDVPYVPTDEPVVAAMLRFGNVGPYDVVYDLGCGDGRIVISAARQCGCSAVGVDIDPQRILECRENAEKARVTNRTRFLCQSFFDTDLRDATVVMLYLLPSINLRLRPKLLTELRPGTRIIANYFDMGEWEPDIRADVHHRVLMQWIVPAWVSGIWRCVINDPKRRRSMVLSLRTRFQSVAGVARIGRKEFTISNGRLFGDQLTFKLVDRKAVPSTTRYHCRVDGTCLRGSCQAGLEGPRLTWGGIWRAPLKSQVH